MIAASQILRAVHRQRNDGGVVDVRVMCIVVLEGPSAGSHVRTRLRPIALYVQDLPGLEPFEALVDFRQRLLAAGFEQRVADKARVPDWRETGLAIGLAFSDDQQ